MKKLIVAAAVVFVGAAMLLTGGCRAVTVENYGEEVAVDADKKPVTLADGKIQTIKKGWRVHHNQHWMASDVDTMEAHIKPEDISFAMGKVSSKPSPELANVIDKSMSGLTQLAIAVGDAYVKIAGGGAQANTALSTAAKVVEYFKAKGGDATKATVTTDETAKTVKVTDGTTCISCDANGNCSSCSDK